MKAKLSLFRPFLGIILLLTGVVLARLFIYYGDGFPFVDEGDKITTGYLIASRGFVLYRDIFSHHLPFTYYWTALIFLLTGPSLLAARVSILLFQFSTFGILMYLTKLYIPFGILSVLWSLISHFYYGHMVLYNVFSAFSIFVVFVLIFQCLQSGTRFKPLHFIIFGIYSLIGLLSDPVIVFPLALCYLYLALSKNGLSGALRLGISTVFAVALLMLALLAAGTLDDFYQSVLAFNSTIYTRYYFYDFTGLPRTLLKTVFTGMSILSPHQWMGEAFHYTFKDYSTIEKAWYSGFFFRAALISFSLFLALKKKFLSASFVYLFACLLLTRSDGFFRMIPFVLVSLFSATMLFDSFNFSEIAPVFSGLLAKLRASKRVNFLIQSEKTSLFLTYGVRLVFLAALVLLGLRAMLSYRRNPEMFQFAYNFSGVQATAAGLKALACGPEVRLAYYPDQPFVYFFSGLAPASRFTLMFPWIAEYGVSQAAASFKADPVIAFIPVNYEIWGYKTDDYLKDLFSIMNTTYTQQDSFYLSPKFMEQCSNQ